MSTPQNSSAPDGPEQSSPVGPPTGQFRKWFLYIIDWIKALSPLGASVYDTGWVNVTVNPGFSQQGTTSPQVRRIGKTIHYRWGFSATGLVAGTAQTVGNIPVGFRPPQDAYDYAASNTPAFGGRFQFATNGNIVLTTPSALGQYYIGVATWVLD